MKTKHRQTVEAKQRTLLVALIIVGLILGYSIYNQSQQKSQKSIPQALTEDERFILTPPSSDASKSALKKHAQMVKKLAQDGSLLEIKDCDPNPLVLKTRIGSDLEIKNQSTTNHRIIIDSKHYYDVPANGSKIIKAEFKYGTGDYGYVCEGAGLVGFLHITP